MSEKADHAILQRMRVAGVPPYAYSTSLALEKQNTLAAIISQKSYTKGNSGPVNYVLKAARAQDQRSSMRRVTKACAVMAKELVLHKQAVSYRTVSDLFKKVADTDDYEEQHFSGYIIIGDFGTYPGDYTSAEWSAVQAALLSHVSRGGGLVLGVTVPDMLWESLGWSLDSELLLASCTHVLVE